jgi:hypothetical protein
MKKKLLITLPLLSAFMLSGCATLFDNKQQISIRNYSNKKMRAVLSYADGSKPQYLTIPTTITIKKNGKDLKIESSDNEFQPTIVKTKFNKTTLFDALASVFGIFSTTTDAATGAMWEYDDVVTVQVNNDKFY